MTGKEIYIHGQVNRWADRNDAFLEHLIYIIGDSGQPPSEDDLLNMIIGFQAQNKWYREQLNMEMKNGKKEDVN